MPSPTKSATATVTRPPPVIVSLDLDIFRLDGSEFRDDEGGQPDDEITIGSTVCVNDDNDDRDATFDTTDGAVPAEDDLVQMVVQRPPGVVDGQVELRRIPVPGATGDAKVWEGREKGVAVDLPATFTVDQLPKPLWVEGIRGSSRLRDVQFGVQLLNGTLAGGGGEEREPDGEVVGKPDEVALTVLEIARVEWIGKGNSLQDDDALDLDPHDPHWPGRPAGLSRRPRGGRHGAQHGAAEG